MVVGKILLAYFITFLIAGAPIVFLYWYFMKKLQQIKKDNGFTDMDTVMKSLPHGARGHN